MSSMYYKQYILLCICLVLCCCGQQEERKALTNTTPTQPPVTNVAAIATPAQKQTGQQKPGVRKKPFYNGSYCALVQYRNPFTLTQSEYTLLVHVIDNKILRVNFPNGGWLDTSHFNNAYANDSGVCTFTTDRNYEYYIQLKELGENCTLHTYPKSHQCLALTKNGVRCMHKTKNSNGLCSQHDSTEKKHSFSM